MLIDWFTVGAQALNFVVLAGLMKHFLYKPVLDAIDAREKRIAAQLADADKKKAAARSDRDALQQKSDAFDGQRAGLLAKATTEAAAERQTLMDAARQAADTLTATRRQTMESDARNLRQALRERTQAEVFAVARQALTDLASASLEASACSLFIVRLRALDEPARDAMAAALTSSHDGALIRTAFELPTAQRTAVHKAVNDTFGLKVGLRYEVAPDLVGGIELSAHGQKFAWSISDYLAALERGVHDVLTPATPPDKAHAGSAPGPAPPEAADRRPAATSAQASSPP